MAVTRPAESGSGPSPARARVWKAWAPMSQATRSSPVSSVTRASRGGTDLRNNSAAASRASDGMKSRQSPSLRATHASNTIMPLGVRIAP